VHVDDLRNLAEGEWLQVLNPLLEEFALPLHDVVHHLEHRLAPLFDAWIIQLAELSLLEMNSLFSPSNFFLSRAIS